MFTKIIQALLFFLMSCIFSPDVYVQGQCELNVAVIQWLIKENAMIRNTGVILFYFLFYIVGYSRGYHQQKEAGRLSALQLLTVCGWNGDLQGVRGSHEGKPEGHLLHHWYVGGPFVHLTSDWLCCQLGLCLLLRTNACVMSKWLTSMLLLYFLSCFVY